MTRYLLDTNVALRFSNPSAPQHELVRSAVARLLVNDECVLTAQVLIEFWVVATRPINVNGLGWSAEQARASVDQLLDRFPLLEDRPEVFPIWLQLICDNRIQGKRAHDIRLIAVMFAHGVDHLLTLNPNDFTIASSITIVHSQRLQ